MKIIQTVSDFQMKHFSVQKLKQCTVLMERIRLNKVAGMIEKHNFKLNKASLL